MSFACRSCVLVYYLYVLICHSYVLVCHLCHSYVMVCHSYVLVCHPYSDIQIYLYVIHMPFVFHPYVIYLYSYATRMSLVCIRMSFVCHSYILVCHLISPYSVRVRKNTDTFHAVIAVRLVPSYE